MTREDVIRLAREAELPRVVIGGYDDELVRFASLVAAYEREQCAKVCEQISNAPDMQAIAAAIRKRGTE